MTLATEGTQEHHHQQGAGQEGGVATEEGKAKFSKQFALNKQAQRVDYTEGQEPAVPSGDDNTQTGGGGTTGGELEG